MEKRVFKEQEHPSVNPHLPKQEFDSGMVVEEEQESGELDQMVAQSFQPPRFWLRVFLGGLALLGVAVFAQSIQWLVETWQAKQWIYFAFSIGFFGISLAGIGALINEWRKLVALRKHYYLQQQSEHLWLASQASGEKATEFCKTVLSTMQTPLAEQGGKRWQAELNEAYNGQEVLFLFDENVLKPIDRQVKTVISKNAVENAVIVAISPLAVVDVFMVAWRHIALVNHISRAYGMNLGYLSRLKLFKMVLTNMAFAGATEMATDLGSEWFTQNLTAKFSMRAAQGIGVGLLTARLGIQAMAFCRPMAFQATERPRLSVVRQELLNSLKSRFFNATAAEKSAENTPK